MGKYKEALKEYEESKKIMETSLGKDHPNYATIFYNIGLIYKNMGKYEEALNEYKESRKVMDT